MPVIWNMSCKICIFWAKNIKSMFLIVIYQLPGYVIFFFFFLVSFLRIKSVSYKWVTSILRQFWMILSPNK